MTNDKQELSAEQKAMIQMRELQKQTLMGSLSSVIGMNGVYAMGEAGRNIADNEATSRNFQDWTKKVWDQEKADNKSNLPVLRPSDQKVTDYGIKVAEEAKRYLTIGDLYEVNQGLRKTKDLEENPVPEMFKEKGLADIVKAENNAKVKFSKLSKEDQKKIGNPIYLMSEQEQEMTQAYTSLSSLYTKKATERTFNYHNGREEIDSIAGVFGKYNPKKEAKASK